MVTISLRLTTFDVSKDRSRVSSTGVVRLLERGSAATLKETRRTSIEEFCMYFKSTILLFPAATPSTESFIEDRSSLQRDIRRSYLDSPKLSA